MKRIKYLFIFALFFLMNIVVVFASDFQPRASLYEEYEGGDTLYLQLWYEGEAVSSITHTFKYDASLFSIENTDSYDFDVETTNEKKDGKYKVVTVEAVAAENHENYNYAIVALKVKSGFNVGTSTHIVVSDFVAEDIDGNKYKNDGLIITINYHAANEVYVLTEDNTDLEETKLWIDDRLYMIIFIIALIVGLLIIFLITPHNFIVGDKKKAVKRSIKNNKNNDNVKPLKVDIDDISSIGEKPKEEPHNKLELGKYNPLENNKAKVKHEVSDDRDFKEAKKTAFGNKDQK